MTTLRDLFLILAFIFSGAPSFASVNAANTDVTVANLRPSVTEMDLSKLFSIYGYIRKIDILKGSKGTAAIVEFDRDSSAKASCALNNTEFQGIKIVVQLKPN